jgi:phenylacetate-CoA ligase
MKKILELIYYRLPIFLQNVAISVYGLYWYKRRFGGFFHQGVKDCLSREHYLADEWKSYQNEQIRKILEHAFTTVPFYKNQLKNIGISKEDISKFTIDDLQKLPILTKSELKEFGTTSLLSENLESNGEFLYSSGSTGTPTKILFSFKMHQRYFSIFESRINYWAGLNYKIPRGVIGGRRIIREGVHERPFYRYNIFEKQTYFSAYHISRETAQDYVDGMIKNKVEYMTGYASANYFLARFIEEAGIMAPKLKAVLTSADKLTQEMRDTFRRVYQCDTFDSYNGVEACNLISECEFGKLHIVPDVGVIEILNEKGEPCQVGETGEVVSTGFLNYDQPLIRYRMGDLICLSKNQHCECSRNMPIVDEIIGRLEDIVIGKDGREMVRFHGIFIDIPSIIEAQVIQHELERFELKIAHQGKISQEIKGLMVKRMISQLGAVHIDFTIVDSIPRNANGKFKSVISHVKREPASTRDK